MKKTVLILTILVFVASSCKQATKQQTENSETENNVTENVASEDSDISQSDISNLWGSERDFIGGIGDEWQKMGIVFLSTVKTGETEYEVIGKSKVKNNICDFHGIMEVQDVRFNENNARIRWHYL